MKQSARLILVLLLALSCCAPATPPACGPVGTLSGATVPVYLVDRGWHTEIGIPAAALTGPLGFYRQVFPGARTILFGYGKKTFFTAPATSLEDYLIGPFPGSAVIQVVALTVAPDQAYGTGPVVILTLKPAQVERLSAFIWGDLASGRDGAPRLVAVGHDPDSLFYAARSRYTLFHTCNGWVAQALGRAGLPVSDRMAVFAGQVMARGARAARALCPVPSAAP
ncbi:conserved hypothetical protein [Gluconacetobacter diazotrophicus PA1 5]|uniref:DUF2459 domain-containing protein n=1 Tax=Gluconacetobacter diazotrophicus TaxID=33996 RepID=UPI000173BBE7|nr:DUF2459 domain-containing protein [Gluconacetobacter diazotrophicus]ACI50601.1 conserved hypothetical protein [Gluconacetobacter diazotrophicus PA1 5]TWB09433.1 uncharacterized protein (TIGR02117 family) [Gluconacetobacter diazotrophicus]